MRTLRAALAACIIIWSLASPAAAQVVVTGQITASGSDCTTAGACVSASVTGYSSFTLQFGGTFSGTIAFEATSDGANWNALSMTNFATGATATTTTTTGQFAASNPGVLNVRARASSWSSGTANVTVNRGASMAGSLSGGGSSGAPADATYWTATANTTLSAEVNLGALTTGLVLNTVSAATGTPTAYAGTSCTNQFARSLNASGVATCASVAGSDFATQTANTVFSGPTSGGAAAPSFRALVTADLGSHTLSPDFLALTITGGSIASGTAGILRTTMTADTGSGAIDGVWRMAVTEAAFAAGSLYEAVYGGAGGATLRRALYKGGTGYVSGGFVAGGSSSGAPTTGVTMEHTGTTGYIYSLTSGANDILLLGVGGGGAALAISATGAVSTTQTVTASSTVRSNSGFNVNGTAGCTGVPTAAIGGLSTTCTSPLEAAALTADRLSSLGYALHTEDEWQAAMARIASLEAQQKGGVR